MLIEESYDLKKGFDAISNYLNKEASFNGMLAEIKQSQKGLSEFSVLDWIKANSVSEFDKCNAIEWALWESTVTLTPYDNVALILDRLCASELRVAAISNAIFSSACICKELDKHNLLGYFEFVVSSADLHIRKPHPELFLNALNRLEVASNDAIYIGDNLKADVLGAASVGMTPVLFGEKMDDANCLRLKNWSETEMLFQDLDISVNM